MTGRRMVCNTCGGSGEIGYFQGESRFFITREECPACCGVGYTAADEVPAESAETKSLQKTTSKKKPRSQ